jgi:hypothetical protein
VHKKLVGVKIKYAYPNYAKNHALKCKKCVGVSATPNLPHALKCRDKGDKNIEF